MTAQQTRTGTVGTGQPAADKTLTVTITMKVRKGPYFYEDFADRIATSARELVQDWEHYADPGQATIEVAYSYPQWKHVYGPGDHDQEEDQS